MSQQAIILMILVLVIILLNIHSFYLFYKDKQLSKTGAYRISEKRLLSSSLLLGGIGALWAMRSFRHKTKHANFIWLVPLSAVITTVVVVCLLFPILQELKLQVLV